MALSFQNADCKSNSKKALQLYRFDRIKHVPHPEMIVDCSVLFSVEVGHGNLESKRPLAGQLVEFVKAKPALACKRDFQEIILLLKFDPDQVQKRRKAEDYRKKLVLESKRVKSKHRDEDIKNQE